MEKVQELERSWVVKQESTEAAFSRYLSSSTFVMFAHAKLQSDLLLKRPKTMLDSLFSVRTHKRPVFDSVRKVDSLKSSIRVI